MVKASVGAVVVAIDLVTCVLNLNILVILLFIIDMGMRGLLFFYLSKSQSFVQSYDFNNAVNLHTNENNNNVKSISLFINLLLLFSLTAAAQMTSAPLSKRLRHDSLNTFLRPILPANYYSSHLSLFCKQELQVEKATRLAIRFRLGSIDYTDYLEQKPNAIKKP